jgi:hypothetical protein
MHALFCEHVTTCPELLVCTLYEEYLPHAVALAIGVPHQRVTAAAAAVAA